MTAPWPGGPWPPIPSPKLWGWQWAWPGVGCGGGWGSTGAWGSSAPDVGGQPGSVSGGPSQGPGKLWPGRPRSQLLASACAKPAACTLGQEWSGHLCELCPCPTAPRGETGGPPACSGGDWPREDMALRASRTPSALRPRGDAVPRALLGQGHLLQTGPRAVGRAASTLMAQLSEGLQLAGGPGAGLLGLPGVTRLTLCAGHLPDF